MEKNRDGPEVKESNELCTTAVGIEVERLAYLETDHYPSQNHEVIIAVSNTI
jgi:hypothetical protein